MDDNGNEENIKEDFSFKILLLGDSTVGKTCFLKRYIDGTFQDAYLSTIGFDFKIKFVTLKDGKIVKVQIWDTAGEERFRCISKSYYKGAHGIILIYDVTNKKTFDNIKKWLLQIKEESSSKVSVVLIANKIDLEDRRKVSKEDGIKLSASCNFPIFEASSKNNINVTESFNHLLYSIYDKWDSIKSQTGTKISESKNNSKLNCC